MHEYCELLIHESFDLNISTFNGPILLNLSSNYDAYHAIDQDSNLQRLLLYLRLDYGNNHALLVQNDKDGCSWI